MRFSLKRKLALIIVISLFLPFMLLGYLWYSQTERTIEHNASYYSRMLLDQTNNYIHTYLSELDRLTLPFLLNPSIQEFLHLKPDDYYGQFLLQRRIRTELYKNLFSSRNDIYKFTFIINEKVYFSSEEYSSDDRNERYLKLLNLETPVTEFTIEGVNRLNVTPVVTAFKIFYDPLVPLSRGILIVDLKLNKFAEIIGGLKFENVGQAYLLNSLGQYMYHPDTRLIGTIADESVLSRLRGKDGFVMKGSGQSRSMISYRTSELTEWTLMFEVPMKHLTAELVQLRTMAFVIFLCIAAVVLLMLGGFNYYLIKSLSLIQQLMKRAETGNLDVRAPVKAQDEIGMLYRSFNRMMDEYRRLIHVEHTSQLKAKEMQVRQKESMLTVLQSQINPHFLYNTLGTIHSYAILAGVQPISRMVTNLADIFRYSMDSDAQVVSLWNEIRYIRTYFDIQKERYEDLFTEIEVDQEPRLKEIPCVKLMLQPLVENALIHGYQDYNLHPDYVSIRGSSSQSGYEIRVIDKGRGMPPEVKEQFNRLFESMTDNRLVEEDQTAVSGSVGLYNVHKRLRLVYGEPYGLWIEKSGVEGTVIRLLVPYDNKAE
ncbi:sensor histidine kinase [Paenibacillus eucommiae]|uniref:Two-component system sensor histidine kinase YesM n=1 Tax=Paenibacillus eucommiae TaxID=1355755 RepID=A0ABS4IM53_9BACL|nr:sensor histidine kinase [Paenibacillus eucommiae]MBP1988644.1 two-component system sensor histidine kinase YesM [Paenibacillus eucommiae]